ncbi:MAG: heme A synthase [Flavobacteriaceae bacterium]|nr:heme A synthase [Flavobacteriaceae bacterium]
MHKQLQRWTRISLIVVYLVIAAGATVRMTGSGMGCPDWPKCFGYFIPPTDAAQLEWKPNTKYSEGNVIINNERLLVAFASFTTNDQFNIDKWEPYTKHDYAVFDAKHTWIEFINRLLGAVSGLAILILFGFSIKWIRKKPIIFIFSLLSLLGILFQAWLGKIVVESNLLPMKISLHMLMALLLVGFLLVVRVASKSFGLSKKPSRKISILLYSTFVLTLVQIALGIEVRQYIDAQVVRWGYDSPQYWLAAPELSFYIHRSSSILVLLANAWLFVSVVKEQLEKFFIRVILWLIGGEVALGIAMFYFDFPFATQPLHLVVATLLFGVQLYWILRIKLHHYDLSF